MSDEIPLHIQEEIIKRLPVVSLLQFRSVSKTWKHLIDSSDFIAAHSVTQPQHLILRYDDTYENPDYTTGKYVSFVDNDDFPQQWFVHPLPQSVELLIDLRFVGCSHGLLCFRGLYLEPEDITETVVLWNPSIRMSIALAINRVVGTNILGFGVCPVTCDPKIVQITQFGTTSYHFEARLYALSSGKWRSVSTSNLPRKLFQVLSPQVVVNRFIYWCASDPMTSDSGLPNDNPIMSFDTTDEIFGVVDLPDNLRRSDPRLLCISNLKESLVILEYDSFRQRAYVVWMMENGVQKTFTKLFTVEIPDGSWIKTTLGFRTNGQPIIEKEYGQETQVGESELVAYEPKSKRFNNLEIIGASESFVMHPFKETLVLLGQSGCTSY